MRGHILSLIESGKHEEAAQQITVSRLSLEEKKKLLELIQTKKDILPEGVEIFPPNGSSTSAPGIRIVGIFKEGNWDSAYINGQRVPIVWNEKQWQFETNVPLVLGPNSATILLVSSRDGKEKTVFHAIYRKEKVGKGKIVVLEPQGIEKNSQRQFQQQSFILKGYAVHDHPIKSISLNGKPVPMQLSGNQIIFDLSIKLQEGFQTVLITTMDEQSNEAEFSFKAYLKPK